MLTDDYEEKVAKLDAAARRRRKTNSNGTPPPWCESLAGGDARGYPGDERNVLAAMRNAPEFDGLTRLNEFSRNVEFLRAPTWRKAEAGETWGEADDTQCAAWLQTVGIRVRGTTIIGNCIAVVSGERRYHPVRAYLESLAWDRQPRVRIWLADYLNAQGNVQYLGAVGMRFLVSAVARIVTPGCQADHVLVLEAPQGSGKTSAARALAVQPEWFAGNLPDIHSKDAPLQLVGRWIIEIAELKAVRNSQLEAVKSFITETRDTFRPPYARRTDQFPRQCVFIATTNEAAYLRDATGNRRYWPVRCGRADVEALVRDRDQLWAEAVALFRNSTPWHLSPEEAALATIAQDARVYETEIEQDVRQYLETVRGTEVTVREVLRFAIGLDPTHATYVETARKIGPSVADALERCGWRKDARRGREKRTTYVRGGQG